MKQKRTILSARMVLAMMLVLAVLLMTGCMKQPNDDFLSRQYQVAAIRLVDRTGADQGKIGDQSAKLGLLFDLAEQVGISWV